MIHNNYLSRGSTAHRQPPPAMWWQWLTVMLVFLLCGHGSAMATTATSQDIKFSNAQLHLTNGVMTITIPFYDTDGKDEGLPDSGSKYHSVLKIDGTEVLQFKSWREPGKPQADDDWFWLETRLLNSSKTNRVTVRQNWGEAKDVLIGSNYTRSEHPKDGSSASAVYTIYLSEAAMKKAANGGINVEVNLTFDKNEDNSDVKVSNSQTFTFNYPSFPSASYAFSSTPGYYDVTFSGTSGDSYTIQDEVHNETRNVSIDNQNCSELIQATENENGRIKIEYRKKYNEYITLSEILSLRTLPAYQQAVDFSARLNANCQVELTWRSMQTNGTEYIGNDEYEIERSTDPSFSTVKTIGSVKYEKSKSYSLVDDVSEDNYDGIYYYRIRRTAAKSKWGWGVCKTTSVGVQTVHKFIRSAKAEMAGDNRVAITWTWNNGNVYTKNSRVLLTRFNGNKGTSFTYEIPADSVKNCHYEEELKTSCDVYSYAIAVVPGNSQFKQQEAIEAVSSSPLYIARVGQVTSFAASKGYFSDHVELEWTSDGLPIDVFAIKAREYGSSDEFKQIEQVEANVASKEYSYSDKKSIPGIVYEYQIVATTKCGDETLERLFAKSDVGFCTPTGDIYGRVTFENGQAVPNVEVRAEATDGSGVKGKAYKFNGNASLVVDNSDLLNDATKAVTIEAWVKPDNNKNGNVPHIIEKHGTYDLTYSDGKIKFFAGSENLVTSKSKFSDFSSPYVHVAAVMDTDSLYIYLNGNLDAKAAVTAGVTAGSNEVSIGKNFEGAIDEVRLWNVARDSVSIKRDYNRHLIGNEEGLIAYYPFDYSVDSAFYDISYKGNKFNMNHGHVVKGATLTSDEVPTNDQLGYRSYTATDGSYSLRSLPYMGNGTTYMIVPRLSIHQFESEKELRLLNAQSQSHTVNFTDKSSFNISGKIVYKGGNVPVEGVSFNVDGVTVMDSKNNIVKTKADGTFTINVPVGLHEVKAVLANHKFENEGKITNSDGTDRNYQDDDSGIELFDITTVRYIGRVAGGAKQEEYVVGHSLSRNNLADSVSIELTYQNDAYTMTQQKHETTLSHCKGAYVDQQKSNRVAYEGNKIIIYPNAETGEFFADLIPENYKINVIVPGHDDIPGSGEEINLKNAFAVQSSVNSYTDSVTVAGKYIERNDTVTYNKQQLFIKRYTPSILVEEIAGGSKQNFFGKKEFEVSTLDGSKSVKIPTYDETTGKYTFGVPVYEQGQKVTYAITSAEVYKYKTAEGRDKEGVKADVVPTPNATLSFSRGDLAYGAQDDITTDSNGYAEWTFQVNNPEMTSAVRSASIDMTYTTSGGTTSTSINWTGGFTGNGESKAIVVGAKAMGADFITQGPDKVLFVLRDPPGSNSYSYLEKGVSITTTSTYDGSVSNEGTLNNEAKVGANTITFAGLGAGVIYENDIKNEYSFGATHSETIGGTSSDVKNMTTTTRFETSSDPAYVGANGDLYVGFSTNIGIGRTENVALVSRDMYNSMPSKYEPYANFSTSDFLLVKTNGVNMSQSYATMFTYTQARIENQILPKLEELRDSMLLQPADGTDYQAIANNTKKAVYVSKLAKDDANFGKSNSDKAFGNTANLDPFDGRSYKVYFPSGTKLQTDTILTLNQSIDNWKKQLALNEEQKVKAELMQNHSFDGGSGYEYSEEYSTMRSETSRFSIAVGGQFSTNVGWTLNGTGMVLNIEEKFVTEHGGEFSSEEEARHCKGFVLAENGDDYISVDVCREAGYRQNDQYVSYKDMADNQQPFSTFIFKTKGGATACPYEGEYKTRYFEPDRHVIDMATVQREVPEITVEKDFIENVPSGKSAYFTLYLRNASESQDDNWYNLVIDNASNPNGAQLFIDGSAIGNGLALLVPAGGTLVKTLEVRKGSVMNYDNLRLFLQSQCQCDPTDFLGDIYDDVTFSVHFTPSATDVNLKKPSDNWTYNTKLPVADVEGVEKHYMDVVIDGFDVNYDNFNRIMLQYKPSSGSDNNWTTLMSYYNDQTLCSQAIANGMNAEMIKAENAGTIKYRWFLDDFQDQRYDLRTVGTSLINNEEVFNYSEVHSGIKDMYNPRLFGSAQPANGVLTVNDEVKLTFNEPIADGLLTDNNFSVTGIRNGAKGDHSVSVQLHGGNDRLESEFSRNWNGKSITVEMWTLADKQQDAVLFSQGNSANALEIGTTADNHLKVGVGDKTIVSREAFKYEQGTWAHVALVYNSEGTVSAYYNFEELISNEEVGDYNGEGNYVFGASVKGNAAYAGKMHGARIWDKALPSTRLQTNSLTMLSGAESNLLAYYPMDEAKGNVVADKARGANLAMHGGTWTTPEGRAAAFNGKDQYLKLSSGSSCVIDKSMDYTMELWFKAEEGQAEATLVSNGRGDGEDMGQSANLFALNLENGKLVFHNNGTKATCEGDFADNDWHHVALAVNRNSGRAQIYTDGKLNTYFDAQDLGGISAAYIHLGARVWTPKDNAQQVIADNFFKGEIDEFRMWKLYRSETLTANGNSKCLDGSEKGLLAYYPFETYIDWQGTKELQFSLKDMKKQQDATMAVADAVAVGGNVETKTSAPVKAKGPESKLLYDFVVNNDALIITLKEQYDRIEKTTVNFVVDGVRDKNGNEILSPVAWSAFIDRNQLKWGDNSVAVNKKLNEEKTFSVRVKNSGGAVEHFNIENLPSWLDADNLSGTVDPTASVDVTFTIDPSLNIGTYDETLYLRGDNNVVEALPLTVKVEGERPEWTVNPADFKYTMSVFGKLNINKVYSTDAEDMLAAFADGKCVGVCNNRYYKQNDMYYAMLTVYSNDVKSDNLEFRIWDASTGATYIAEPEQTITFVNNSVTGSPAQPVVFNAKDYKVQNIALNEGWTWISVNVASPKLGNLNSLLADNKWTADDQVKNELSGFASWTKQDGWVGSLPALDNEHMFLVHSSVAQRLSVAGTAVDTRSTKLTINGCKADGTARWNYISYLPQTNLTLKEALAGYDAKEGDIIKSQTEMAMYTANLGWIGSLSYMESGKGYMMQRQAADEALLQYPSVSSVGRKAKAAMLINDNADDAYFPYATNMTAVVAAEGIELQEGDRLVSYVGGERRGHAEAVVLPDGKSLFLLTVGGESQESVDMAIERDGKTIAKTHNVLSYAPNNNVGTVKSPLVVDFQKAGNGLHVYPSPFETQLTVSASVDADADVEVTVTDLNGHRVCSWSNCNNNGTVEITWNVGNNIPNGVYFVSMSVDGVSRSVKVLKK